MDPIKWSAPRYKRERNLFSYNPWPFQSVDVTANKHVTIIKSKILKDDFLNMDSLARDTILFVNVNNTFFTTAFEKIRCGSA